MGVFSELQKYGYRVDQKDNIVTIRRKKNYTLFIAFSVLVVGLIAIPNIVGNVKIILLFLLFILYPITLYRKNSFPEVSINVKDSIVVALTPSLIAKNRRFKMRNSKLAIEESFDYSYATAHEDGNKEFVRRIMLKISDKKTIELFSFRSRNKEELQFVNELLKGIEKLLHPSQ